MNPMIIKSMMNRSPQNEHQFVVLIMMAISGSIITACKHYLSGRNTKKIVSSFSCLLLLISLCSCSSDNKLWLVSLGEQKETVKDILDQNKIPYTDQDTSLNINSSIKYLDCEWNEVKISFEDNKTSAVNFIRDSDDELTKDQKKTIVYHFDKIYGEHKNEKSSEFGLSSWSWDKDEIVVLFMSVFKGKVASLLVCKKKESSKNK